jgi:hypothetical protein
MHITKDLNPNEAIPTIHDRAQIYESTPAINSEAKLNDELQSTREEVILNTTNKKETSSFTPIPLTIETISGEQKSLSFELNGKKIETNRSSFTNFLQIYIQNNLDIIPIKGDSPIEIYNRLNCSIEYLKSQLLKLDNTEINSRNVKSLEKGQNELVVMQPGIGKQGIRVIKNSTIDTLKLKNWPTAWVNGVNYVNGDSEFVLFCRRLAESTIKYPKEKAIEEKRGEIYGTYNANTAKILSIHSNGNDNTAFGGFGGGKSVQRQNTKNENSRWSDLTPSK